MKRFALAFAVLALALLAVPAAATGPVPMDLDPAELYEITVDWADAGLAWQPGTGHGFESPLHHWRDWVNPWDLSYPWWHDPIFVRVSEGVYESTTMRLSVYADLSCDFEEFMWSRSGGGSIGIDSDAD